VTFSFHRGSLSLDFVGTVGERGGEPVERLPDPEALRRWLAEAGLGADLRPNDRDLRDARTLRDAIGDVFEDLIDGRRIDGEALARVNLAAEGMRLGAPQIDARLRVRWVTNAPIAVAFARIAADAIELLSHDAERLTRCARHECSAILLSHSRSEPRKWCSMELCGNRAKVAAYRARAKSARSRR
jgi:predicted RNA-binding Zn ribbon-like protein